MNILIYGDSNTWGQIPNINGYSKDAIQRRYDINQIWWYPLTLQHSCIINGLPGRAISNDNPWIPSANAMQTITKDLEGISPDLVIMQLGTNDCKNRYNLTAEQITNNLDLLIKKVKSMVNTEIMIVSPAKIIEGNKITDKYYIGASKKSEELDKCYKKFCEEKGYCFVSGIDLQIGEDGEHLTPMGHKELSQRVETAVNKMSLDEQLLN